MTTQTQTGRRPLTIIVAMTPYGVIGRDGKIPWNIPEDMNRFKVLTTGHAIVMGRKTYQSIGRPLPSRTNIVISQNLEWSKDLTGFLQMPTLADALREAYAVDAHPFVIGGKRVYEEALPFATRLEITYVLRKIDGDTHFPMFPPGTHQPDVNTWSRTSTISAAGHTDVEFSTFVRRGQPLT